MVRAGVRLGLREREESPLVMLVASESALGKWSLSLAGQSRESPMLPVVVGPAEANRHHFGRSPLGRPDQDGNQVVSQGRFPVGKFSERGRHLFAAPLAEPSTRRGPLPVPARSWAG